METLGVRLLRADDIEKVRAAVEAHAPDLLDAIVPFTW
jgi:hypothetical protein